MCGIIGYIGKKNGVPIVFESLKRLEYRGYDSFGIAALAGDEINVIKSVGKIQNFDDKKLSGMSGSIVIGHTRWATHGAVTEANAHPHLSNDQKIAIVHNGIIENYQELRNFLESKGFKFSSQTDTEVIPNLIEFFMRDGTGFVDAAKKTFEKLEGSYAVVAVHAGEQKLLAARKESPLTVGIGDGEFFFASDIPAFLEHTKKVVFLEEGDMVVVDGALEFYNILKKAKVSRAVDRIDWDAEQARKGEFDHFMMKEISEQAEVIDRAVNQDPAVIKGLAREIRNARGVYFVACGTAGFVCQSAIYLFSKIAKKHINFALASEFPNFVDFLTPESLVIAVSQSGETADVLLSMRAAKEKGARVISIVNVMGSAVMRESDQALMMHAGPEICVLATKSYTAQIAIITLLAYAMADKYEEGRGKLKELVRYVYYLTSKSMRSQLKTVAEKLKDAQHLYIIGRNLQYPIAMEAALKIKEVSYIHAEAYAGGELKHGSIALIEKGTPCIVFTSTETEKEIIGNACELKARGAYVIGVGPKNNEVFDDFIKVREAEEANSICQVIPMQILAYQLALLRGCDPDKPRNIAKTVTVK